MSECPYHNKLKADLPMPMPLRIARLPVGKNGYPIPFFVADPDDFRIADPAKMVRCIKERLCWVCGQPLGIHMAFVIGPMCTVNRISGDPPTHLDCAVYSCRSCPFLVRPNMVRREDEVTKEADKHVSGIMIKRNPGVMAIWVTKSYKLEPDSHGVLFRIGNPESIQWWREGRYATRAEIEESIKTGIPLLREHCYEMKEHEMLDKAVQEAIRLLPAR
jgi:hypothetical protein